MTELLENIDKIGILDPKGKYLNPLTNIEYSEKYLQLSSIWSSFPAYKEIKRILKSIEKHQLIFIISGTGSGKTVLIPKFALHYTKYKGKIAITLPKIIATESSASFAADTLDVKLGKDIGYIFKGSPKNMNNENNKLIYMTDGTLIMKFLNDPTLSEYNVIIIDEAHERKVQIDIILLLLKKLLLSKKRPDLKVIIMSATIDGDKYQNYFKGVNSEIINISGQPNHPIKTYFTESPVVDYMETGLNVIRDITKSKERSDLLFFITTGNETIKLCSILNETVPNSYCVGVYKDMADDTKIFAINEDNFKELGDYKEKLVMATNVAESSVTIKGLKYVIDSGYELFSYFDPTSGANILDKRIITKAQAFQRRGRVGRTEPGTCYHLLTEKQFNNLGDYPIPDILKQDITIDLIKIIIISEEKTLKAGLKELNSLMDPPEKSYIDYSLRLLDDYKLIDNNRISKLGLGITAFSSLTINRSLFLLFSYDFYCAKEAAIIIAMMEASKGKFMNLFHKTDKPIDNKIMISLSDKRGDHLSFLKIYKMVHDSEDISKTLKKYNLNGKIFASAKILSKQYYYKTMLVKNKKEGIEETIGGASVAETTKNIINALKKSHIHMLSISMKPSYHKSFNNIINVSNNSIILAHHQRKDLLKKKFIYDDLVCINKKWEYTNICIVN